MRVLMYADRPAGLGGIETHVAGLAAALARLGVEVTVAFNQVRRAGAFQGARSAGVRLVHLDRSELGEFASGERVDIVHAHSSGAAEWGVQNAARLGIKLVVTLHGPGQQLPSSPGKIDRLIAVSPETARPLLPLGDRISVIENGIDLTRFRPSGANKPARRGEPLRVAYLGRVGPTKRPGLLALHGTLGARSDIAVRYVSDWAPTGDARPTDDPASVLQESDIVFSTGRGVREAMACGAAACVLGVFWDGAVTPESLEPLRYYNFSGRATRRRPLASDIAQTVGSLIHNRRRLSALKRFGREIAARHWDIRRQAALTLRLYEEVTAARGLIKI